MTFLGCHKTFLWYPKEPSKDLLESFQEPHPSPWKDREHFLWRPKLFCDRQSLSFKKFKLLFKILIFTEHFPPGFYRRQFPRVSWCTVPPPHFFFPFLPFFLPLDCLRTSPRKDSSLTRPPWAVELLLENRLGIEISMGKIKFCFSI